MDTVSLDSRDSFIKAMFMREEIFDLLWSLDEVRARDIGRSVARAIRLWDLFFGRETLYPLFSSSLWRLGRRQLMFVPEDLVDEMRAIWLGPRRTNRKIPATIWLENIPELANLKKRWARFSTEMKKCQELQSALLATRDYDYKLFLVAFRDLLHTFATMVTESTSIVMAIPALLTGGPGVIEEEVLASSSILDRVDARSRVQGILEDVLLHSKKMRQFGERMDEMLYTDLRAGPAYFHEMNDEVTELEQLVNETRQERDTGLTLLEDGIQQLVVMRTSLAGIL